MNYQDSLRPWAIFRTPNSASEMNICVARFRSRSDADAYMSVLYSFTPGANFRVVYDLPVGNAKGNADVRAS